MHELRLLFTCGQSDRSKVLAMPKPDARSAPVHFFPGDGGRTTLLLSLRRVDNLVGYCANYEFEDLIAHLIGADRVEPETLEGLSPYERIFKATYLLSRSPRVASRLTPRSARGLRLDRDYDLFFPVFNHAGGLTALGAVPDWRARCRYAACYVNELWLKQVPEHVIALLADFDRIYVGLAHAVDAVTRITGRPCSYLPMGVDALQFSPHPDPPPRSVHVAGIGRRSAITHDALLAFARERGVFYYYDTIRTKGLAKSAQQMTFPVSNHAEHRFLLANLLKRTRYFIANRSRFNEPDLTDGIEEVPSRFYEGAAAGTVMIGAAPRTAAFDELFDWPDALISAPVDMPAIGDLISGLDADPGRTALIRRTNVANSLLRHDWTYRLRTMLSDAGVAPTPAMLAREERLRSLSQMALSDATQAA
jgi:hypothetical protein